MLTTKTKVSLAALAYRLIARGRGIIGRDGRVNVRRGGILWSLDLSEGIDFSIYLLGSFERSTVISLRKLVKPGDVVFDIGANIGAHTLGLAKSVGPVGRVYAFEPTDFAFGKLSRNLALNPELQTQTCPVQMFLTSEPCEPKEDQIYASWPLKGDWSVHPKHRGRLVTTRGASIDTLDHFVDCKGIDRLDLIKLDVDGHELPVLCGGLKVLKRFRPVIVMEMSPYIHAEHNHRFVDLVSLLRNAGYTLEDASAPKSLPLDAHELEALIPDGASINVIARASSSP